MGALIVVCFVVHNFMSILVLQNHTGGEEKAGCFAWFVFLVSVDCCVSLPRSVIGLSAVCDCGNS